MTAPTAGDMDAPTAAAFNAIHAWMRQARPKQLAPIATDGWREFLVRSGRGWGKTECAIGTAAFRLLFPPPDEPGYRVGIIGKRMRDNDLLLTRPGGILSMMPPRPHHRFNKADRKLELWNGSSLICFSAEEPQAIRGDDLNLLILDEASSYRYPQILELADFICRRGRAQKIITTTLKRNEITRELMRRIPPQHHIVGSTAENTALPRHVIEAWHDRYDGTALGRQELHGEFVHDIPGAIFAQTDIEAHRTTAAAADADLAAGGHVFAVGIDPQGAHRPKRADIDDTNALRPDAGMTGIVVASRSPSGDFYVWHDASMSGSPTEWAQAAVTAAQQHGGGIASTALVPETNFGGDMVVDVLRRTGAGYTISPVRATDSKTARAEPISVLYHRGRVHHVGIHAELEDEMTSFTPESRDSPNRMDALVWAITALMRPRLDVGAL